MRYGVSNERVIEGVSINELLFGQSMSFLTTMGLPVHFAFENYHVCLTGIPKPVFEGRLGKSLASFFELYSIWREATLDHLASHGIVADIAVVKYDQSKRVCCLMQVPNGSDALALNAADFMHRKYVELYTECWDVSETDCPFVTALSPLLNGVDDLSSTFAKVRDLADLAFFLDRSCVMTLETKARQQRPLSSTALALHLEDLEQCVVKGDAQRLELELRDLFFSKLKPTFDQQVCNYTLGCIRRIAERYNKIYLAGVSQEELNALTCAGQWSLRHLFDDALAALLTCAKTHMGQGVGVGAISFKAALYLREHYAESFTIKDLSDCVGVSPSHLSRVFNKEIGESIPAYLTRVRLDHAARLLQETDESAANIGQRVGFASAQYFNNVFKRERGMTPAQYRAAQA